MPAINLAILTNKQLQDFRVYQIARLKAIREFGFCAIFEPVAKELKVLAENELDARGIHWDIMDRSRSQK